jgi:transposase
MGRYRKFDHDFQQGAVQLVLESGKPIAQIARELGINDGTLGNWVAKARRERGEGAGPLSESERAELARLRKENAELRMQRDVLKRSVALPGRAGGHLRPVVADGEQDRAGLVVGTEVDPAVGVPALDKLEQPLAFERVGEGEFDLGGSLLGRDDLGEPPTQTIRVRVMRRSACGGGDMSDWGGRNNLPSNPHRHGHTVTSAWTSANLAPPNERDNRAERAPVPN